MRLPRTLALIALLHAGVAAAGPCETCDPSGVPVGWWDDRAVTSGGQDHAPRIDVDGPGLSSRIAIAWERRDGADGDVYLGISDDGGCSFDARTPWPGASDDRLPDVAVSQSASAVGLAFIRDGVVVASISLDGGASFPPPAPVAPAEPVDALSRPRLAMIPVGGALHVFVAWCEGGRMHFASNLASGADGAWRYDRLSDYIHDSNFMTDFIDVELAADTRSSDVATRSAVTLVFTALAAGASTLQVFSLRSNNSGDAFSGNPEDGISLFMPERVSDARPVDRPLEGAVEPALDVSDDGTGEFYTWEVALYTDQAGMGEIARVDGRAEEGAGPTTIADWHTGRGSDATVLETARAAAVSVIPNPLSRPPSPEMHAFVEVTSPRSREIAAWRGILDANVAERATETCAAYALTGLAPPRAAGEVVARSFAADEDLSHVFVAWEDSRGGGSDIFFKRTDTVVDPPTGVVAVTEDCAVGGGLRVSWQLPASPPNCDAARVRIDYGFAPGALDGSVEVAPSSPATLAGLPQGATVYVRLSVIDEACNVAEAAETWGISSTCAAVACPLPVGGTLRAARQPTRDDVGLWWAAAPVDATHDAATSYDAYRSTTLPQQGFALIGNAPTPDFLDMGAALPGSARRHFYLVIARNACGTSGDEPLP